MDDMEMDQELLAEFLTESNEGLGDIEQRLLSLETNPDDEETINGIFRAIHTVKGTCGFLGLGRLESLSHATESLLGKIRSEKFQVDTDLISLLLEAIDAIKTIIAAIEENGAEPDSDYASLTNRLKAATRAIEDMTHPETGDGETEEPQDAEAAAPEEETPAQTEPPAEPAAQAATAPAPKKKTSNKTASKKTASEKVEAEAKAPESATEAKPASAKEKEAEAPKPAAKHPAAETSIRVDTHVVDELMNQIGELVLTRNRLLQMVATGAAPEVQRITRTIDHTTNSLQDQVLRLRMQPVGGLWSRAPRVVRDLAHELGKRIQVVMEGEETELDRFILAALRDPMTHIIRNSCDHGIETPEERRAAGKPEEGTILLSARQESGNIIIEVKDDGKGIDASRVSAKAVDMGLITREMADRMSTGAALQLIFHPGLSTAKAVSKVSGRGVGMDVVRAEIEKTGGSVEVDSRPGTGTTLRMRIPLTLAIIPSLVVRTSEQQFAIPQMNVQELIGASASDTAWESYAGSHFYRLRDKLLPVVMLSGLLDLTATEQQEFTVVVITIGSMKFGLAVDDVVGAEEIVVKPLGVHFQKLNIYAGCSILGDGGVVPIIDCNGLMQKANLSAAADLAMSKGERAANDRPKRNLQHVVLFEYDGERYAIPMSIVQRLETIPRDKIEKSGGTEVLQYRGDIIPLRHWHQLLNQTAPVAEAKDEEMACVILSDSKGHLCLEVGKIVDVGEVPLDVELGSSHSIFLGTAVIFEHATEVVDVYELVKAVAPEWFGKVEQDGASDKPSLLLLEDSPFFRDLLMPTLESMGYAVWAADSVLHAKAWLEQYVPHMIVADLDMPDQQSMDLARWVKNQQHLDMVPIVALASFQPRRDEDAELFTVSLKKTDSTSLRARLQELAVLDADVDIVAAA